MKLRKLRGRAVKGIAVAAASTLLLTGCGSKYVMLHPAGPVGLTELHLMELSAFLVFLVIVPVILLLAIIVVRYRDRPGNKAPYQPEWSDNRTLEVIWWGIPIAIVTLLGIFTAKTTFALTRPPENNVAPMTVEVTSLDWKWLFQYPGQKIATVNYCVIPTGVPIQFVLTANSPMNSFWVPQLGGQEYAMPGMAMRLWLQANQVGDFYGHGANFTGKGFAQMTFHVLAKPETQFATWVRQVKTSSPALTMSEYRQLAHPGEVQNLSFSSYPSGIFYHTVMTNGGQYMASTMQMEQNLGHMSSGGMQQSAMSTGQSVSTQQSAVARTKSGGSK